MKKNLILLLALAFGGVLFTGCSEDKLQDNSIIVDNPVEQNALDKWLYVNYVETYNIDMAYRYQDVLSDLDYNLTPVSYKNAIIMSKLTRFLCLETYDELLKDGGKFIRTYFPKIVHLIGSPAYNTNNTIVLGTAEGGKMMTLYMVNSLPGWLPPTLNMGELNDKFFKTMHHEFGHILHQTKPYSPEFNKISGAGYIGDNWSDYSDKEAWVMGFVTAYSMFGADEDFVELYSLYITCTEAEWNFILANAIEKDDKGEIVKDGKDGRPAIIQKLAIVKSYMDKTWGIDLDDMRKIVLRRQSEVGTFDLTNI